MLSIANFFKGQRRDDKSKQTFLFNLFRKLEAKSIFDSRCADENAPKVPSKRKVKKSSALEVAKKASEDRKEAEKDAA
jgi:hypothetical protein